jgi:hypothetical protein
VSSLTDKQQKSLLSGIVILVIAVFLHGILPNDDPGGKILLWSMASIIFAAVISYSFVLNDTYSRKSFSQFNRFSARSNGFKPKIIPPSAIKKKTQFKGNCDYCGESALLGFTCSYCKGFYCSNHRIPEKHLCSGLYNG